MCVVGLWLYRPLTHALVMLSAPPPPPPLPFSHRYSLGCLFVLFLPPGESLPPPPLSFLVRLFCVV